jgi:hypothetical protein
LITSGVDCIAGGKIEQPRPRAVTEP